MISYHFDQETKFLTSNRKGIMLVEKVTKVKPDFTFDIEVNETHTYQLGNGCVSHNTVSSLVDSSSGIHPRFAKFYARTVRNANTDPLLAFMKDKGFPVEDSVTKPGSESIFTFPVKSPDTSVFRDDMSAIEQLEHYLIFKNYWCEHNPSITVYVKENEWLSVGDWVYNHFDSVGGISFLPHSDHIYKQAPYTEITEKEYNELLERMPKDVDWEEISLYEKEDSTTSSRELACSAGVCEIL